VKPTTPPHPRRPHRRARVSKGRYCLPVSRICAPHEPPETSQIRDSGSGTKIIRKCTTSWLGCPVGVPGGALSQKTGHFTDPWCLLPHLCGCRAKNETRNNMITARITFCNTRSSAILGIYTAPGLPGDIKHGFRH
jgi:hypothetical protein